MSSRYIASGVLGALVAVSAVSAVGPTQRNLIPLRTPGTAHLQTFGSRSAEQGATQASKFDAALAHIARHVHLLRPGHEIEDLHALNPAVKFHLSADAVPLVSVDAVTEGDPQQLRD